MVSPASDVKVGSTARISDVPSILFASDGSAVQTGLSGRAVADKQTQAILDAYIARNPELALTLNAKLAELGLTPDPAQSRALVLRALCETGALKLAHLVDKQQQPILRDGKPVVVLVGDTLPSQAEAARLLGLLKGTPKPLAVSDTYSEGRPANDAALVPIRPSVTLPTPASLKGKNLDADATEAYAALQHSAASFEKSCRSYTKKEERAALLYTMLRDASGADLQALEQHLPDIKDKELKKALDNALRVRHAQLPGGPLYGIESPAAIEKYRAFVGPKCDAWMHKLGISADDLNTWLSAPPGSPLPASIEKVVAEIQAGKTSNENVNFLLYGLPMFTEISRARGVASKNEAAFSAQIEWAEKLYKKIPGLAINAQKAFASQLEQSAAFHDKQAAALEEKAKTKSGDEAKKLRQQAETQRAIATKQRNVAIETRASLANMYQRGIEKMGGPEKAPAALKKQHTEMADGVARVLATQGRLEAEQVVEGDKRSKESGYDSPYPTLAATLPKALGDQAPVGKPGEKGYDAGGATHWVQQAEKLNPNAVNDPSHVATKDGVYETKKNTARAYLEIRGYPPSAKGPFPEPGSADTKANMGLRGEVVGALVEQRSTLMTRAETLQKKTPRTAAETEELVLLTGRLQTVATDLSNERKLVAASQLTPTQLRDQKKQHEDAVTGAANQVAALDSAVAEARSRVDAAPNDEAKAVAQQVQKDREAQLDKAKKDQTAINAAAEAFALQLMQQGEPARANTVQFIESAMAMRLRKAFPGKCGNEVGPPVELILAPAVAATDYVEAQVVKEPAAIDKLPAAERAAELEQATTLRANNAVFYGRAAAISRGEANMPTLASAQLAQKAEASLGKANTAFALLDPKSQEAQLLSPMLTNGAATVSADVATVLPRVAREAVGIADRAQAVFDPNNVDPKKPNGERKTPQEIETEKKERAHLASSLKTLVANTRAEVAFGAYRLPAFVEPGGNPPAKDYTAITLQEAKAALEKIKPETEDTRRLLARIGALQTQYAVILELVKKRREVVAASSGVSKREVTMYHDLEVETLERTQSFVVDLPILSTSILGWGALFSDDIRRKMNEHDAWTMGQLREREAALQLRDKLAPLSEDATKANQALDHIEELLTKAAKQGREAEAVKLLQLGRTTELDALAREVGASGSAAKPFSGDVITSFLSNDRTAFGAALGWRGNYFQQTSRANVRSALDPNAVMPFSHTEALAGLKTHQGAATGSQAFATEMSQRDAYRFAKDMLPYQIAVAGGELVLGIVVPGAALRSIATIGRVATTARTAVFIARAGAYLERARETSVAVRGITSMARTAAQARSSWIAFEQSGKLASFAVKVVEGYAIFGIQKGATYLAQKSGVSQTSFGGKLLYFSIQGIGASAQNRVARMSQFGEQLILPGMQFVASSIVIPQVFKDDPKKQQEWNHAIELAVPVFGAIIGVGKEIHFMKRQSAEASVGRFNEVLKASGHDGLSEAQLQHATDLVFSASQAKDQVSLEKHQDKLAAWAKEQKLPESAQQGLRAQAAVAYAARSLGPEVRWDKKPPSEATIRQTYEKVLADLRAAHPQLPLEHARMLAQQLVAHKAQSAMHPTTEAKPLSEKEQTHNKQLDGALQSLAGTIARDAAAARTLEALNASSVVLPAAARAEVQDKIIPDLLQHLAQSGDATAGKALRDAAQKQLVEKCGCTEAQAKATIDQAVAVVADQVAHGHASLLGEGEVSSEALRLALEHNLTAFGRSSSEAHSGAVDVFAKTASGEVVAQAHEALVQSHTGHIDMKDAAKAETLVAEAMIAFDKTALAQGKDPSLSDAALMLEMKLAPVVGVEAAHQIAKATMARLVAEVATARANGSGPGLPKSYSQKDTIQAKTHIDALVESMREVSQGTKPAMFSELEIQEARRNALNELVADQARASLTTADVTPKELMQAIESTAHELRSSFPELDPKQVSADLAVKEATRHLLETAGPKGLEGSPELVNEAITKLCVEQFGVEPAAVKQAMTRRQELGEAVSGKATTPVGNKNKLPEAVVTLDATQELIVFSRTELDQAAKLFDGNAEVAFQFLQRKGSLQATLEKLQHSSQGNSKEANAITHELSFLSTLETLGAKNPRLARAAFQCIETGPAETRFVIEGWLKSDAMPTSRVLALAEALKPLAKVPRSAKDRISGEVFAQIADRAAGTPSWQLRGLVEKLVQMDELAFAKWQGELAAKDPNARRDEFTRLLDEVMEAAGKNRTDAPKEGGDAAAAKPGDTQKITTTFGVSSGKSKTVRDTQKLPQTQPVKHKTVEIPANHAQVLRTQGVLEAVVALIPAHYTHRDAAIREMENVARDASFQALPPEVQQTLFTAMVQHVDPVQRKALATIATSDAFAALTPAEQAKILLLVKGHDSVASSPARQYFMRKEVGPSKSKPIAERATEWREALANEPWLNMVIGPLGMPQPASRPVPAMKLLSEGSVAFQDGQAGNAKVYEVTVHGEKIQVTISTEAAPPGTHLATIEQVAESLAGFSKAELARIKDVRVNPRPNSYDVHWAQEYNIPDFHSAATAGAGGLIEIYPWRSPVEQLRLNTTMTHEFGHVLSQEVFGTKPDMPGWQMWHEAIAKDPSSASKYAKKSAEEDFSETLAVYTQVRGTVFEASARALMPERFDIIDTLMMSSKPPLPVRPGFDPIANAKEYKLLATIALDLQGNEFAAHAWMALHRDANKELEALKAQQPPNPEAIAAAQSRIRDISALPDIEPITTAALQIFLASGFGMKASPMLDRLRESEPVKAEFLMRKATDGARLLRNAPPHLRDRATLAFTDTYLSLLPGLIGHEGTVIVHKLLTMDDATYAVFSLRLAAADPKTRLKMVGDLAADAFATSAPPSAPPAAPPMPASIRPPTMGPKPIAVDTTVITEASRHHVHDGLVEKRNGNHYLGKWSGIGGHTWSALTAISARDKFPIERVLEDPATGVRDVEIVRTFTNPRSGEVNRGVVRKTVYPTRFSEAEVDGVGATALAQALAKQNGSVPVAPGSKAPQRDGSPSPGRFEAEVQVGSVVIKVEGWYRLNADGKPEVISHYPVPTANMTELKKTEW